MVLARLSHLLIQIIKFLYTTPAGIGFGIFLIYTGVIINNMHVVFTGTAIAAPPIIASLGDIMK